MKTAKLVLIISLFFFGLSLSAVNVRAEVLSVSDIIDVLVSFSNKGLWEKAGGECFQDKQFTDIKRKNNNSVEWPGHWTYSYYNDGGLAPRMPYWSSVEIKGPIIQLNLRMYCGSRGSLCDFHCSNEIEVVSRTHVKVRQKIVSKYSGGLESETPRGINHGDTFLCEFRKK
jgi:hypothetical protein